MELNEEGMIEKIVEVSGVSREDVLKKVEEKLEEFGGLVSRAGAIIIVGKELGVDLVEKKPKILKIANLVAGLNQVNLRVKIIRKYASHEFSRKGGGSGKVINLLVGDETGIARVSVWNEKAELLKGMEEGDVVEIVNGYTKEDGFGGIEVRIGRQGTIKKVEGIDIEVPEKYLKSGAEERVREYRNLSLYEAQAGDALISRVTISLIFERNVLHYLCPTCRSRLTDGRCEKHGEVKPDRFLVLSGIVDDGSAAINFVAFRKDVETLLEMSVDEIEEKIKIMGEKRFFEEYVVPLIGREFMIRGVVRKSDVSEFLEIFITKVWSVNYEDVLKELLENVENAVEMGG